MMTLKEQIFSLRAEGKSFNQIAAELNCSKGTISYHLSREQQAKTRERTRKLRSNNPLLVKIERFRGLPRHIRKPIQDKTNEFSYITPKTRGLEKETERFTPENLLEKCGNICYLTGRVIDIRNPSSYQLDHVQPRNLGGRGILENCGLTCAQANVAKGKYSLEEFFQLCWDVCVHNDLFEKFHEEEMKKLV